MGKSLSGSSLIVNRPSIVSLDVFLRPSVIGTPLLVVGGPEETDFFRSIPPKYQNLRSGAFSRYFSSGYQEELDIMSREQRIEEFNALINATEKFDRLVGVISSHSLLNNIDSSIDTIVAVSNSIIGSEEIMLYKFDSETNEFLLAGYEEAERYSSKTGIVGQCFESQKLFNIRDPSKRSGFNADIDFPIVGDQRSMMAIPIFSAEDKPVGVLIALNKRGKAYFEEDDEYAFKIIATCVGIVMGNSNVLQSMNKTQKKIQILLDTTRSLASILDLDKLIKVIMDSAKELLTSDRCTLFLHEPERNQLRFIVQGRDSVQEIRIPSNAGIAGAAFTSAVPINIQDAYRDSRFLFIINSDLIQKLISRLAILQKLSFACPLRTFTEKR
jgi:GAF domain-containing protein